ncbi:MAG: indole-3-glycerol phosphate synthase TrpC [Firmicutes bacterium]|nr:indole-3-glycerol phosphate synthase TrpC [Bacillota bacterium]
MTFLADILDTKRSEIKLLHEAQDDASWREKCRGLPRPRGFVNALRASGAPALIAEIKRKSPSKGVIAVDFDPLAVASAYEAAGATALSVLTDREWFGGSARVLQDVRAHVSLPILRKDFIIDPVQVYETRAMGADALLLIIAALSQTEYESLYALARSLDLDVLVEVHSREEWRRASAVQPELVGINNRDLATFDVSLTTTEDVAAIIHEGVCLVAESGIATAADVRRVLSAGAHAILVGETLMRAGVQRIPEVVADLTAGVRA